MCNSKIYAFFCFFLAAIAIFFVTNYALAGDDHLIISEILVSGISTDEEFIEIFNPTLTDMDLKLLPLRLHIISSTGTDTSKTLSYTTSNTTLKSHEYFVLASSAFKETHPDVTVGATYSAALVSNGAAYISTSATKNLNIIDLVCWGSATKCDFPLPNPKSNQGLERIENGTDWQESCEAGGTPGEESTRCPSEQTAPTPVANPASASNTNENYSLSGKIYLNEIFPNPKDKSDEEYIEIANGESEPVDLYKWVLRDGSKSGKYVFKEHVVVDPGKYIVIYKSQSKIALNNSNESVFLYDPEDNLVSSVSFEKSIKNSSYNFDEKTWKWSKYLTPGAKNKFDSPPIVKINRPKNVFKDIAAEFSAEAKDKESKKLKYSWDFGDRKKSSQKKTTHKYSATGKYTVTLSVSDESQTIERIFVVTVKNFPRPDLEIVKIVPNPAGADTDGEAIDIKNNSKKKVNLTGWKIATGSDKKMYNHPIAGEFLIEAGKTKAITREFSKFSLNNKAGKLQLAMPDGKTIDEVEYSKDKIVEDEAYAKIDGEWEWLVPNSEEGGISHEEAEIIDDPTGEIEAEESSDDENTNGEILGTSDENINPAKNYTTNFSSENAFAFLSRLGFSSPPVEPNYCPLNDSSFSIAYLLASSI